MVGFRRGEGRDWPGKGGKVVLTHLGFHSGAQTSQSELRRPATMGWRNSHHVPNVEASTARPGNACPRDALGAQWKGPEGVGAWW
jgi:hypothetical protein